MKQLQVTVKLQQKTLSSTLICGVFFTQIENTTNIAAGTVVATAFSKQAGYYRNFRGTATDRAHIYF